MAYFRAVAQPAASTPERIGVLLVNLGAPDSPSYFAVQRYLRQYLGARRVPGSSRFIWLPLLYGVILPVRPIRTLQKYRAIWMQGGAPLLVLSKRLTDKMGALLNRRIGANVRVALAMNYGNPGIEAAVQELAEQNVKKLLVLPLYPQFCSSTTGAAFDRASRVLQRWRWLPETRFVNDYHDHAGYIDALADSIRDHWARVGERSHLIFSYHEVPAAYIEQGDPYQAQAQTTTRLVAARLGLSAQDYSHCYQSRVGDAAGLQPYTENTLLLLAQRGLRKLTIVSASFAVDCLETLEDCAIEYRDKFLAMGGGELTLVPALNDDDRHALALADIVHNQLAGWIPAET